MSNSLRQIRDRLCICFNQVKKWILEFNIFRSRRADPVPTQYELETQLISTRIFLLLFAIPCFIIVICVSQIKVTINVTVENPTYDKYLKLSNTYSATLSCPCTKISITYGEFISITASYHQVCVSIYTTSAWQNLIYSTSNPDEPSRNFRYTGGPLFQILSLFCDLTRSTISDGLIDFNTTQFISLTVIPHDSFDEQTDALISLFISSTVRDFVRSRAVVRDEFQLNHVVSTLFTNYEFYYDTYTWPLDNNTVPNIIPKSSNYYNDQLSNCSCENSPFCTESVYIDDNRLYPVPGMFIGCYLVEALLQSNLACFYNQSCIADLVRELNSTILINTTALDQTIQSPYELNSTIGTIVDLLMVEQWTNTTSHEAYYVQCHPVKCTYNFVGKRGWLNTIATIITPMKGLIIILQITVLLIIKVIRPPRRTQTSKSSEEFFS